MQAFYKSIDEVLTNNLELTLQLKMLRDIVQISLTRDKFRLNCIEQVLDTMDCWHDQTKPWNAPPIFYHEKLNYSIRIVFWPAFYENNPHKHKTWGVTGVFHNELNIHTYAMLESPMRLKKERTITAVSGEVGYLAPGCIHNVNNTSHDLSASIHIFNNVANIDQPEENAIWYPLPRKHNLSNGLIDRALMTCLSVADGIKSQQAFNLIDRIYARSSLTVKLMAIKALYQFDHSHARLRFNELEKMF